MLRLSRLRSGTRIMKFETLVVGLLAPLFAIIGVIIGSYLSHAAARDRFLSEKQYEMRVRGYSELISLRLPISQTLVTLVEAKLLTEFYDFRFQHFSHAPFDLNLSQEENKRMLGLIPEFSKLQRELFKALAEISLAYPKNDDVKKAVSDLYRFGAIEVSPPDPQVVNSADLLDKWKADSSAQINPLVEKAFKNRFEKLIAILDAEAGKER